MHGRHNLQQTLRWIHSPKKNQKKKPHQLFPSELNNETYWEEKASKLTQGYVYRMPWIFDRPFSPSLKIKSSLLERSILQYSMRSNTPDALCRFCSQAYSTLQLFVSILTQTCMVLTVQLCSEYYHYGVRFSPKQTNNVSKINTMQRGSKGQNCYRREQLYKLLFHSR